MNILDIVNPVKPLLEWGITIAMGAAFYSLIKKEVGRLRESLFLEVNSQVTSIDDPNLRKIVKHAIRYAAKRLPDATGNERLDAVIKAVQDATPNFIISDDQLKELIQTQYTALKGQLGSL